MKYLMCIVIGIAWPKLASLWVGPPDDWNAQVWIAVLFISLVLGWLWSMVWHYVADKVAR